MAEHDSPDWDWNDPAGTTRRLDEVRSESARCGRLEELSIRPPYTRRQLRDLGVTGIEFAAFKTEHPEGLAADFVPVGSTDGRSTWPGRMFRLDGGHHFIELDVTEEPPFDTACADWVYAEHLLEDVPPDTGISWLQEARRILRPAGLLRLTTPDLCKYVRNYLNGEGFFAEHRERLLGILDPAPPMPDRPDFMINQIFYFYGHRWIYDEDEVKHVLTQAGFDPGGMRVTSFRKGHRHDVAMLDQPERNDETIYVEALA